MLLCWPMSRIQVIYVYRFHAYTEYDDLVFMFVCLVGIQILLGDCGQCNVLVSNGLLRPRRAFRSTNAFGSIFEETFTNGGRG